MEKVLVAGSTGYLGQFVVRELKKRGYWIRALARNPSKLDDLKTDIDEIVIGEITEPNSLDGICQGIDIVFSSVGITRQKGNLTFKDVDYQGNKNLLDVAWEANIRKFIYVSVFDGPNLTHLDIIKAHEDFVMELKASGISYTVVRPTGYYSDMEEFLKMAKQGRVYLFGKGNNRMNPIHGEDLAVCCVDAIATDEKDVNIGGPEVYSYREIAEIALKSCQKPVKISSIPVWLTRLLVKVTNLFNRHKGGLLDFMTTVGTMDVVAPCHGTRTLKEFYVQKCNASLKS